MYAFRDVPWNMKNGINNFHENHPGSIIILKTVNDPLRVWEKIKALHCFDVTSILSKDIILLW